MSSQEDFRDTLYTIDKTGRRKWVYPHYAPGRIFRLRTIVAYSLMLFYLVLPWVEIGGKQGVLLDIPHRHFVFFGLELWATDTIFLFLLLASLGLSLFLFTALLGRVWCGWACPETVFLEFLFRPIERLIEGSDAKRKKLDKAPWTFSKILKKLIKHALCAFASWILASTALAYFVGREQLLEMMTHSPLENLEPFIATLFLMGVMAFQFGWFREQFCTVMCPYARFQSVLMDPHSLLVGYDKKRGEPRGKLRDSQETGDCVDCKMCIRVCPTGIDIRNGTQLECVACAACIDACNSIMDEVGRPRGLIRYDTEAGLSGLARKIFRPRLIAYSFVLLCLITAFAAKLHTRSLTDIDLVRVANNGHAFEMEGDTIVNQFTVHLANKGAKPTRFRMEILNAPDIQLVSPLTFLELKPEEVQQMPLFIRIPKNRFRQGVARETIMISDTFGSEFQRELNFFGPE